eukprot:14175217-Alexandrium_andersonii.AAC.1
MGSLSEWTTPFKNAAAGSHLRTSNKPCHEGVASNPRGRSFAVLPLNMSDMGPASGWLAEPEQIRRSLGQRGPLEVKPSNGGRRVDFGYSGPSK